MPRSLYLAADFSSAPAIAVEQKRNPETGILTARFPISWCELADYNLGEIRRSAGSLDRLPAEYQDAPDSMVIKVLHHPDQVSAPDFVASCYSLPLMAYEHAMEGLHMLRAGDDKKVVGLFGRDMQMREINGIMVPTLDAAIHNAETQLSIEAGNDESSLCYSCGHDWTGGVWKGTPYQMEHILNRHDPRIADLVKREGPPRGNHCTIALAPGDSRGYRRTHVFMDMRGKPHEARYAERMRFPLNAAAARRMPASILALAGLTAGKIADGPITVEVPDSDTAAVQAFATALAAAVNAIATGADESAAGMAEAQTALTALQATVPELEADAAEGRKARLDKTVAQAVTIGCPADKLATAETVEAVKDITIGHMVPALIKRLPAADGPAKTADRRHSINVAWDTLVATSAVRAAASKDAAEQARAREAELQGTRPLAADAGEKPLVADANLASDDAAARASLGLPPAGK